jgi:predicted transcriptional regulator
VQVFIFFGVNEMGKHRSRLKILEDILSVINGNKGVKKTQIMYKAYLSYKLLTRYLNDVSEAGLVICDDGNCYWLTEKGEKFLAMFGEYSRFHESVEKQLNQIEDERAALKEMCPNNGAGNAKQSASKTK